MTGCCVPRAAGHFSPALLAALTVLGLALGACAADRPDPAAAFAAGKVWQVHITLSAEEYAAIEPRAGRGFPGFGALPMAPDKPADPKRKMHRNNFGMDLPWGVGDVTVGEETFKKASIRYKGNGTGGSAV